MKLLNSLSSLTKVVMVAVAAFLVYGYLCRLLGIYFFWESKTLGWTLLWVAVILVLRDRVRRKKLENKNSALEKIGIGLTIFLLLIMGILFFAIPQTALYAVAVNYVKKDKAVRDEIGDIKEVFFVPFGGASMSSGPEGSQGEGDLNFVVKGSKKYIDLNLVMSKELGADWKIGINR